MKAKSLVERAADDKEKILKEAERIKKLAERDKKEILKKLKEEPEPEKPFDFGGLPQRDLKKNLGCG